MIVIVDSFEDRFSKLREALVELFELFKERFKEVVDTLHEIKEFFYGIELVPMPKFKFPSVPIIPLKSQVLNRKPMMIRARCNC